MPESHVREVYIAGQKTELDVGTLATEQCVADEIDTSSETSPVTVLTPSSGKKIETRSVYLATDSNGGEVEARFKNSGKLIAKAYCSYFKVLELGAVRLVGDVNEEIEISWSGLSSGSKIFYVIRYKEVE